MKPTCGYINLYTRSQWCSRVLISRVRVESESLNFSAARVRVQVRVLGPRVRVKSESSNLSETRVQVESRVLKSYLLHKNRIYCILISIKLEVRAAPAAPPPPVFLPRRRRRQNNRRAADRIQFFSFFSVYFLFYNCHLLIFQFQSARMTFVRSTLANASDIFRKEISFQL